MKSIILAVSFALATIALALSLYHIRFQRCRDAYDQCIYQCDSTQSRALGENQFRRSQINIGLQQDLLACGIDNLGNQTAIDQCQNEKITAADQELAELDAADEEIRQAHTECATECLNDAKRCDRNSVPTLPPYRGGSGGPNVDFPSGTDCLEGGAPCFKPVLDICKEISGPCGDCWKALCGGGDWSFESSVPVEVILVAATDPKKETRVLANSTMKGTAAVLPVPSKIKLNKREQLYFGFKANQRPSGAVRIVIRRP